MRLHFHEPPAAQRAGGLDAAIRSLQAAVEKLGHSVSVNCAAGPAEAAHFHGLWQPGFPALARQYRALGVPYVVSPHGMLEPWAWRHKWWKKFPYWHLIEKRWMREASCVLATGEPEARRLADFLPQTLIQALPLGLTGDARPDHTAARTKLSWTEDEIVLLFLSRIHSKKGLDLLLVALGEETVPPKTRLVIVGPDDDPQFAARCRRMAYSTAGRRLRIEWRGAVWGGERWSYLQGADLLCLPSHSENFGLVVLEACQVGTPPLTTSTTPWADSLNDRGYICEPEVGSVRKALARFFANGKATDVQRTALAEWAWASFDWDALAPRYVALYEQARTIR